MAPPVEGSSSHYFTDDAARVCAEEIRDAGGVEVFFVGRRDETGLICEVEAHAYGTKATVPAIINLLNPGEVFIHNHPGGNLLPSEADMSVASTVGNLGVGCYIIDDRCTRCRVVVKPQDARKKVPVPEEEVLRRLRPGGNLSQLLADFEDRPPQREMAREVAAAFNHDGIAVVEAGTGTGKSFAYLVPAILYALKNNERVVISTNTINLQEQLLHKDVPALRQAVGEGFEVEIVKGRSNYVCKRKADYARHEGLSLIEDDFQRELREVLDWAAESSTGDLQDLPVRPQPEVWERVRSESDNCLRVRCPFYEECFFYNSRRRAARARLLIVNHSLLMSDLAVRRASNNYSTAAVLPPYNRVILDEAHHLEEVATNNLAQQITRPGLRQIFGRLYRKDGGGGRGVLANLGEAFDTVVKRGLLPPESELLMKLHYELIPRTVDVRDSLDFAFNEFSVHFMRLARIDSISQREQQKIRLVPAMKRDPLWDQECERVLMEMASELTAFIDMNRKLHEILEEMDEKITAIITNPMMEWGAFIGRLDGLRQTILSFLDDDNEHCRWVELWQRSGSRGDTLVRLCLAPVDVREVLKNALHDRMKTEVLTSATLAVDRKFDYFQQRCGLPGGEPEKKPQQFDEDGMPIRDLNPIEARPIATRLLPTPFDYARQVFFAVPTDMPDPREGEYDDRLADLINRSVAITGGRAFILFTSYGQLQRVHNLCEPTIRRLGVEVLRQGSESRDLLLRRFRDDETSVLFATSSFWEGVDVRGRALELLIIAKLPFAVPTEPVQEAQFEAMKAQGLDPFDNLVVPRAVIRLKQGFGRLIRSRTDRGAVIVADKRVVQARYGRRFLNSLPDMNVRKGYALDLMRDMRGFFSEG